MPGIRKYTAFFFFFYVCHFASGKSLPVVLWHGMGDSCCFSFSMGAIKKLIEETVPGIYVYSIRIGNNEIEDVEHSYIGNINEQIQEVCGQLLQDDNLKDGYNAIGFSQGAQFLRAVIQRCPDPPVVNYISLGGQHQGVFGMQGCGFMGQRSCDYIRQIINHGAYLKFIQEKFIQATYWHDPYEEDLYRNKSVFLADINNERYINQTYIDNLQNLDNMVLVKFDNDTMVWPPESEWFGFYEPGQASKIQPFDETNLYIEDRLGLKSLKKLGKIKFLSIPGNHLQFTTQWFIDNIIQVYLV